VDHNDSLLEGEEQMKVIHQNERATVGILSGVEGTKDLGLFNRSDIEEWLKSVRDVFGDYDKVYIQFKESEDTKQPGYMICASSEGGDPKVAVCGLYPDDGKQWGRGVNESRRPTRENW
jgi:hypothetical protein